MCVRVFWGGDFFADTREGIPGPVLLVTSSDHRASYTAGRTHTDVSHILFYNCWDVFVDFCHVFFFFLLTSWL